MGGDPQASHHVHVANDASGRGKAAKSGACRVVRTILFANFASLKPNSQGLLGRIPSRP
jgi:hypothetical protein